VLLSSMQLAAEQLAGRLLALSGPDVYMIRLDRMGAPCYYFALV